VGWDGARGWVKKVGRLSSGMLSSAIMFQGRALRSLRTFKVNLTSQASLDRFMKVGRYCRSY
jgi:hypothetical protein